MLLLTEGGALRVHWELSADDSLLDDYNIYRKVFIGSGETPREYISSVPAGCDTFVDRSISVGASASYIISAAHHGGRGIPAGNGDLGIWNDFSTTTTPKEPIDNLSEITLVVTSGDTLKVCPAGDFESLSIHLAVLGSDGLPTPGIPADEILFLVSRPPTVKICEGDTLFPEGCTDASGTTELVCSRIGGCGTIGVTAQVMGKPVLDTLTVTVRSPDCNGDGIINSQDVAILSPAYPCSQCTDPKYNSCVDYNLDCKINSQDLATIAGHYCPGSCPPHNCSSIPGSMVAETSGTATPSPVLGSPAFEVSGVKGKVLEDGKLSIPVRVKGVASLIACHLVVKYDGEVTGAEFVATNYLHDPIIIPAKVDPVKKTILVALAGSGGVVTRQAEGTLGSLIVEGTVLPHSLEIVEAEIVDGNQQLVTIVQSITGSSVGSPSTETDAAKSQAAETKLFQSVPNPANPTTTISFSLKERCRVTLRIYDVNGQVVRTLVDQKLDPNRYDIVWDATDDRGKVVSSGIYFYRVSAGGFVDQKKLVILK